MGVVGTYTNYSEVKYRTLGYVKYKWVYTDNRSILLPEPQLHVKVDTFFDAETVQRIISNLLEIGPK